MPSNRRLDILPEAEDDIDSIWLTSLEAWGLKQAETYGNDLYDTIESLLRFPYRGIARPELFEQARSIVCRKHIIYYQVDEPVVSIVRVLHSRLDVSRIFRSYGRSE